MSRQPLSLPKPGVLTMSFCLLAAVVTITRVDTISQRELVCPRDVFTYSCVIQSFSPQLELTWRVTPTDLPPVSITYSSGSIANITSALDMQTTTVFYSYSQVGPDGLRTVESVLMWEVPDNFSATEFVLECFFIDGYIQSVQVRIDAPSKLLQYT